MSYYRYITGVYKSYWPELNRTLRSSSVPRTVPDLDSSRYVRGTSMPPNAYYSDSHSPYVASCFYSSRRNVASPFADRALSVPPSTYTSGFSSSGSTSSSHYSDFDCKVISYAAELTRQETTRRAVSRSRDYTTDYKVARHYNISRNYPEDSFSSRYDYYDGNKHGTDGLYPCNKDVLGTWKHYNISAETLNARNSRARSPLQSRELDRYFETRKRVNYIGDCSAGGTSDFRYYNYRRVPYFGGSDNYQYMKQKPTGWGGARRL